MPENLSYILVPLLLFFARVLDVSLETVRIILVARGMKLLSSVLGFFEILIWLLALGQIMQELHEPVNYLAYALGFATGNFVGIWIENKLAMGLSIFRIITQHNFMEIVIAIQSTGYGVTYVEAHGERGPGVIIFAVVKRKDIDTITQVIKALDADAFYTIEDVRSVNKARVPTQRISFRPRMATARGRIGK